MKSSIRSFLLFNLLLAIIFVTTLSAIGDYYLSQADVRDNMDTLLEQMGTAFTVIVSNNLEKVDLLTLEKELNLLPIFKPVNHFSPISSPPPPEHFWSASRYYFQLWDNQGHLLLYSHHAQQINLNIAPRGLSDLTINGRTWRIFKIYDPVKKLDFVVGERYDLRNRLLHQIALNNLYVMFSTYLLAGILIWVIVGWGFMPLQRLTDEIRNRAPTYLEPVDTTTIPVEIRPLIEELNKLFGRLREAFEREKRFAGDAAHELRTPLAILKTQVQVMAKSENEMERNTLINSLLQSVDRITHIIQQLLTLSRLVPEAASFYDVIEISFSKLTAEIIAQLFSQALEKHIDIGLEAPQTPLFIKGNLTSISILIRNVIDNAIRYTPPHGRIQVEIVGTPHQVIFKVTDNGRGIPPELRTRVFERFYRVTGNTATGSGLGLAIVKQIADLHQASIKLDTPVNGHGLQVIITFPRA